MTTYRQYKSVFTRSTCMLTPPSRNEPEYGRNKANIFSYATWSWVSDIIKIGKQRPLTLSDIDQIAPNHSSKILLSKFLLAWNTEIQTHSNPSLIRALYNTLSISQFWTPILSTILGYFVMILIAIFLRYILLFIEDDTSHNISNITAYYYCGGLSICTLWIAIHGNWLWFAAISNGIDIRVALTSAVIHKSLNISSNAIDSSKIINLLTCDIQRFEETLRIIVPTLFPPFFIILTFIYFSYVLHNWWIMVGLVLFVILIPMQLCFGLRFGKYKDQTMLYTDQRLKIINEAILNALVTKFFQFEESLLDLVEITRKKEMKYIRRSAMLRSVNKAIYASSQCILILIIFLPYFYANGILDITMIYPILAVYTSLKIPLLWFIPYCVQLFSELYVSTRRISQFLKAKSLKELNEIYDNFEVNYMGHSMERELSHLSVSMTPSISHAITTHKINKNGICIKNGNYSWDKIEVIQLKQKLTSKKYKKIKQIKHERIPSNSILDVNVSDCVMITYTLKNININIKPNEFVGIIGAVGAGKSALLSAIVNEIPCVNRIYNDEIDMDDNIEIGYASQKPWILNDSIRNNILFGNKYDEKWYNLVIDCCELRTDLQQLPYDDYTIIGERGTNLSGGQKSRINIARAIYCKPQILLIDNCLSHVDSIVAKRIFDNVLSDHGLMKHTIRLLVTNQLQFLSKVNSIIVMKDGKIEHNKRYCEIKQKEHIMHEIINITEEHSFGDSEHSLSKLSDDNPIEYYEQPTRKVSFSATQSPSTLVFIDTEHSSMDIENVITPIQLCPKNNNNMEEFARRNSIVKEEKYETGSVSYKTYLNIINSSNKCMKIIKLIVTILLMTGAQICLVTSEFWLGLWASQTPEEQQNNTAFQYIYYLLAICTIVLSLWRSAFIFNELLKSAETLSNEAFEGVLYSKMIFFESNPVGRILNRFSKDQQLIDDKLPLATYDWIESITTCFIVFILIGLANLYLYIVCIPVIILIIYYGKSFLCSSRILKRLDANTRSPIYALFSVVFSGLDIIRTFKKKEYMLSQLLNMIDVNTRVYMIYHSCVHWLGFRLDICVFIITSLTAFVCVYIQDNKYANITPAAVGVTLTYILLLSKILPWTVRQFSTIENIMTSVERVIEYKQLIPEESIQTQLQCEKIQIENGSIQIKNLYVSYRDHLDDVLHDINIEIKDCEKIGVCGRTGCGKTTLFLTLFRILNISSGSICINNININTISLHKLRSVISIIPQNPILLNESLRYNIDPFNQYTNYQIYNVLKDVQLFDMIQKLPNKLSTQINENGSNLSVGQCQLICIARALLNKKSKILLIDEGTASIDTQTDQIIQDVLKRNFENKTVLTIAHRLNTIINNDRIIVIDKGHIVEIDTPNNLMSKPNGIFAQMLHQQISK